MHEVTVKEARENLKAILDRVANGEEILIHRRGKEVARLLPPQSQKPGRLPSLKNFRKSIRIKGRALSAEVVRMRRDERY